MKSIGLESCNLYQTLSIKKVPDPQKKADETTFMLHTAAKSRNFSKTYGGARKASKAMIAGRRAQGLHRRSELDIRQIRAKRHKSE